MEQKNDISEDCPKCGYPTTGQYFGIYKKGLSCDKCGYIDVTAAREQVKIVKEREERIIQNRKNPPQFKTLEDWKKL